MAKRTYWIGTSWKMNKTLGEARVFAEGLKADDANAEPRIQRFVIPPFTAVREVATMLADTSVKVGAQNMHWADSGAWTGEISAPMLRDCEAQIVELGHSERREFFGETDETVGLKVAAALRHGLVPLICIGETARQKEEGRAEPVLAAQVEGALRYVGESGKKLDLLFAYEPVWAIGDKGVPASSDYADHQQKLIRARAEALLGRSVPCLYGGSVNPGNCVELIQCPNIDGLFIGRSAWDVQGYIGILKACAAAI
jgi:L-erythrulose 1-phosphate isomerase